MAVRVLDEAGHGTTAEVVEGIYYAVNNGAKIMNMSLGGSGYDQAFYDAIQYAGKQGVIVVASAGNDSHDNDTTSHKYPCDFDLDNIIGVAALDQSYERASFSNYGAVSVDVGAPGTNIQSPWSGSESYITDLLKEGWIEGGTGGWAYAVLDVGYGDENLLVNPSSFYTDLWENYNNDADDRIWKTFDIAGYDAAVVQYWIWIDLQSSDDVIYTYCKNGTSDPFENGTYLIGWTGTTDDKWMYERRGIPPHCITTTCTLGFRLRSNDSGTGDGVGIVDFRIKALSLDNDSYDTINGTSMAAPHVSGLAALIWTLNPQYSHEEVIESVKNGGETVPSLANKTTTGKAVNAWGSLKYIKSPTGVSIMKQ
jgi:subtilisin family serine protease